jgi:hypothetical protein
VAVKTDAYKNSIQFCVAAIQLNLCHCWMYKNIFVFKPRNSKFFEKRNSLSSIHRLVRSKLLLLINNRARKRTEEQKAQLRIFLISVNRFTIWPSDSRYCFVRGLGGS